MLILSLSLLFLSIALLTWGIWGRVAARGVYCRACRFDLEGIDRTQEDVRCPECGKDISSELATRSTLRKRKWGMLVAGILFFMLAGTLLGIAASNNTARVMAALPDRVVLTMHRIGFDAAFTEIATNRLVRKEPLSDEAWDDLIEAAMAHQADASVQWDPRHGEVLVNAAIDQRLTDTQLASYLRAAIDAAVEFPEAIRHGTTMVGFHLKHSTSTRISAVNRYGSINIGDSTLSVQTRMTELAIIEPEYFQQVNQQSGGMFIVPQSNLGTSSGGQDGRLNLSEFDWDQVSPESEIQLAVTYEIRVHSRGPEKVFTSWTAKDVGSIKVLPEHAELVKLNKDPEIIEHFNSNPSVRLKPIYIVPEDQRWSYGSVVIPAESDFVYSGMPVSLAGDLYVLHDGQETRFSGVKGTPSGPGGIGLLSLSWAVQIEDGVDEELLQSWLDAGEVTVEYRPNPAIAESTHDIREILGIPVRFDSVQVTDTKPKNTGFTVEPGEDECVGRPITEPSDS